MWSVSGYQNQKIFLDNALENKRYAHAYLFCGPQKEAKLALAREFAAKILGSENSKAPNPDLISIPEGQMKIEDVRNLISELSLKPFQYEYKVAIIPDFENTEPSAANGILKTLEEPNPSTILILLASNKLSVLPTIASRCQILYFNEAGKPETGDSSLEKIAKLNRAEKLAAIKDYAEKDAAELQLLVAEWIKAERNSFLSGQSGKYSNLQNLIESLGGLKQNFNKKLVLEKLFLNLV